jgi:Holliday junction resolvase RusA-like endonuclease
MGSQFSMKVLVPLNPKFQKNLTFSTGKCAVYYSQKAHAYKQNIQNILRSLCTVLLCFGRMTEQTSINFLYSIG